MRKTQSPIYKYIESVLPAESQDKKRARFASEKIGLDAISISTTEAHIIQWITQLIKPQKIVEIGTLTGLSSLYFLESLTENGHLWTFEKSKEHSELAAENLYKYIKSNQCTIVVGDAVQTLPSINHQGPFDVIFIDGNKSAYYDYWIWAKNNINKDGFIFIDNSFLAGAVWGNQDVQKFNDKQINNVKKMTTEIFEDLNFKSSFVPTLEGLIVSQKI